MTVLAQRVYRIVAYRFLLLALIPGMGAYAQTAGGLTADNLLSQFNALEARSAATNQAVYERLRLPDVGCTDSQTAGSAACDGLIFDVFSSTRELVHTANLLNGGGGPTDFNLGFNSAEPLGFALRWTAAEELAAQGSSVKQFNNSQLGSLASRITALRFGARGSVALGDINWDIDRLVASNGTVSPDPVPAADASIAKRWGVYLDSSYGFGDRNDTTVSGGFENAFDYDSQEVTLGLDYRLRDNFVLGILAGYTTKEVDFDSSLSVVDGGIKSDGGSLIAYALWESDRYFVTGSLGGQKLNHDTVRRITYPSFNLSVPSTEETALSSTDSTSLTASLVAGIDFRYQAFTVEPYIKFDYQDISIDGFAESNTVGFDLLVGSQDVKSLDGALGLRLQYVWTPSFGVVVPYLRGELHRQFEDGSRAVRATYLGIAELQAVLDLSESFVIPTDKVDEQFAVLAAGASVVIRNGLQGFVQYQVVSGLDNYSEQVITGGVRFEY